MTKKEQAEHGKLMQSVGTFTAFVDAMREEFPGFWDDTEVDGADLVDFIALWLESLNKAYHGGKI